MNWLQLCLMALAMGTSGPKSGMATYYSPGVMEQVYSNRLAYRQVNPCPTCKGQVSLIDCDDLGKQVYVSHSTSENLNIVEGPFLAVDCAPRSEQALHESKNHVLELSYDTAQEWLMRGPMEVRLCLGE